MRRILPAQHGFIKRLACMLPVNLSRMKRNYVQAMSLRNRRKMMVSKLKVDESILAGDFRSRPAQWDDLNAVAQLIYEVWDDDGDLSMATTPDDLRIRWQSPGFNLEQDAIVV